MAKPIAIFETHYHDNQLVGVYTTNLRDWLENYANCLSGVGCSPDTARMTARNMFHIATELERRDIEKGKVVKRPSNNATFEEREQAPINSHNPVGKNINGFQV